MIWTTILVGATVLLFVAAIICCIIASVTEERWLNTVAGILASIGFVVGLGIAGPVSLFESRDVTISAVEEKYDIRFVDWGHEGSTVTYMNADGQLCEGVRVGHEEIFETGCKSEGG